MAIEVVVPEGMQGIYEKLKFGPAVVHGDLVFLSGQIGMGATPEEQFRAAWQQVEMVLKAAGSSLEDVLEITSYHVGLQEHGRTFQKVKNEFFDHPYPAWTAVGITELAMPSGLAEIRVIAKRSAK